MFQQNLMTILMAGVVSIGLPVYAQSGDAGGQYVAAQPSQQRTAAVFKFAVQSEPASDAGALSSQACPGNNTTNSNDDPAFASGTEPKHLAVDPKILDAISNELRSGVLKKKMSVMMDPDPAAIPVGSLVITGCIFRAEKGSATGRMIGMNVGASRLGARVIAMSKTEAGFTPVDSFDVLVKGGTVLPPLGPAGLVAHAAMQPRRTLSADAKKLADRIVKKLESDIRGRDRGR